MNRGEAAIYDRYERRGDQQQPTPDRDKQTAGGRWIKRDKDVHRCDKPTYAASPGVKTGDLWECGTCHKVWRVSGTDSGDQRDPYPTQLRWVLNTPTQQSAYDR